MGPDVMPSASAVNPRTMRAVVLSRPGGPENLVLTTLPLPQPPPGWVRIAVRAFGLNRSELHTRLGLSQGVSLPRVLGIEAVGVIDELNRQLVQTARRCCSAFAETNRRRLQ